MKQSDVKKLPLGLYRVYWKSGKSSLAAVGQTATGNRWIAPINWAAPSSVDDERLKSIWSEVDSVRFIES